MSRFILVVQVHDGKDRTHAGRSTHTPDTPHDRRLIFMTKMCTIVRHVFRQLSFHALVKYEWEKFINGSGTEARTSWQPSGHTRCTKRAIRENLWTSSDSSRPKLNLAWLSFLECWIGWERSEVGWSNPSIGRGSRLSSNTDVRGSIRWTASAVRSRWSDGSVRTVWLWEPKFALSISV